MSDIDVCMDLANVNERDSRTDRRATVNLYNLRATGLVEFRDFPGTRYANGRIRNYTRAGQGYANGRIRNDTRAGQGYANGRIRNDTRAGQGYANGRIRNDTRAGQGYANGRIRIDTRAGQEFVFSCHYTVPCHCSTQAQAHELYYAKSSDKVAVVFIIWVCIGTSDRLSRMTSRMFSARVPLSARLTPMLGHPVSRRVSEALQPLRTHRRGGGRDRQPSMSSAPCPRHARENAAAVPRTIVCYFDEPLFMYR
ncbi:hypothetical protein LSAT2_027519 [Lamellibrachia satsuma]|nr:hypothetical protein LSAT2_027519 [Lamellibrachia satsuma]